MALGSARGRERLFCMYLAKPGEYYLYDLHC